AARGGAVAEQPLRAPGRELAGGPARALAGAGRGAQAPPERLGLLRHRARERLPRRRLRSAAREPALVRLVPALPRSRDRTGGGDLRARLLRSALLGDLR